MLCRQQGEEAGPELTGTKQAITEERSHEKEAGLWDMTQKLPGSSRKAKDCSRHQGRSC